MTSNLGPLRINGTRQHLPGTFLNQFLQNRFNLTWALICAYLKRTFTHRAYPFSLPFQGLLIDHQKKDTLFFCSSTTFGYISQGSDICPERIKKVPGRQKSNSQFAKSTRHSTALPYKPPPHSPTEPIRNQIHPNILHKFVVQTRLCKQGQHKYKFMDHPLFFPYNS